MTYLSNYFLPDGCSSVHSQNDIFGDDEPRMLKNEKIMDSFQLLAILIEIAHSWRQLCQLKVCRVWCETGVILFKSRLKTKLSLAIEIFLSQGPRYCRSLILCGPLILKMHLNNQKCIITIIIFIALCKINILLISKFIIQ